MGKFSSIEPVPGATKAGDRCCRGKGRYERGCQGAPDNRQERQWDRPRSRGSGDPWPPPGPPQPCTLRRAAQSGTREFPGSPTGLTKLCSRQRTASSFQGGLPGGLVWSLPASAENEAWTPGPGRRRRAAKHSEAPATDQVCCGYGSPPGCSAGSATGSHS